MNKSQYNINSFGQTGGITAGQVNIHKPIGRTALTDSDKTILLNELMKSDTIEVVTVFSDPEAYNYAELILNYLINNNYKAKGVNPAMYAKPITGLHVNRINSEKIKVIVGYQG